MNQESKNKTEKIYKTSFSNSDKFSKTMRNTFYKSSNSYNTICNNCGKSGHLFHQCKMPIISIGIIVFRIVPNDTENDNKTNLQNYKNKKIEYLIIRRKETLGYIDFMRGKYSIYNKDYIMNMLKQMTNEEKQQLKSKNFDELWKNIWGGGNYNNQYKLEENSSREKFNSLIEGVQLHNDFYTLNDLIEDSNNYTLWEEPEWGFPKGRRNNAETDLNCALREFSEETGYFNEKLVYLQNVIPFEEIFTGSNYKSYKHKYFLMYMNYKDTLERGDFQTSEVSKVEWKTFDECIKCFRPYNLEKIRILKKAEEGLRQIYGIIGSFEKM